MKASRRGWLRGLLASFVALVHADVSHGIERNESGPTLSTGAPASSESSDESGDIARAIGADGIHVAAPGERSEPLLLAEVLASADANFPLLQAIRLEGEARAQQVQRAAGGFDTQLGIGGDFQPMGFYENRSAFASIDQPTPVLGSRLYAKYRYGAGDYASYDGGRLTDDSGELSVGIELPLLRGRRIDAARADVRRAQVERASFGPELELERIEVRRDASIAYWDWVSRGQVVEVAQSLLGFAEARQSQIERRVAKGREARINLIDNERLVVERRARLRGAERDFRQAALLLSLFLRGENGERKTIDFQRLPPIFPEEELMLPEVVDRDLARARLTHPRLRKLALERERRLLEVRLARNDVLPNLRVGLEGSRDFGESQPGIDETGSLSSDSRSATEVKLRMRFDFPVQRREARGRLGVAQIRLQQLDRRIHLARDQVETEALFALEALETAFQQTLYARQNRDFGEVLRSAEARRLEAGLSNLIDLNIRENQAATAARDLIEAQQAYFRALAEYEARVARDV